MKEERNVNTWEKKENILFNDAFNKFLMAI